MPVDLPFKKESLVPRPPEIGNDLSGRLRDGVLVPCGIRSFRMTADAARAVRAMVGAASTSGVLLDATGTYRSFDDQVKLFLDRYEPCSKAEFDAAKAANVKRAAPRKWEEALAHGHPSKFWRKKVINGKLPEDAASPGSSTHGIGVSIDWARTDPNKPASAPVGLNVAALRWLADNAPSFGMWNTSTTEQWHFSHFGPGVTPAVLAFEAGAGLDPLTGSSGVRRTGRRRMLDLSAVAAGIARAKSHVLFLGNRAGNDAEAVQWLRIRLNVKMHLTGTGFQLDESSADFDAHLHAFVIAFQEQIQRFVEGVSGGAETFTVDGRVDPDTWFWLFV